MKYHRYIKSGKRFYQSFRRYSKNLNDTFKAKGMAEENRYFLKRQQEEIKRLREQIIRLESNQQIIQEQLEKTNKVIDKICNSKDCVKEK